MLQEATMASLSISLPSLPRLQLMAPARGHRSRGAHEAPGSRPSRTIAERARLLLQPLRVIALTYNHIAGAWRRLTP